MEVLIQHVRDLISCWVAPDADELKVYDAFKAEFLAQAESTILMSLTSICAVRNPS